MAPDNKKGEKMRLKKVQNIFLAAALICSLSVTPIYADPSQSELEDQKEDAQSELTDLQSELDALITKASERETEMINTGQEITQAEAYLESAEAKKE